MGIQQIFLYTTTILHIILGILVLVSNRHSRVNQSFTFFSISIAFWAFTNAMFQDSSSLEVAYIWAIIAYIAGLLLVLSITLFAKAYPNSEKLSHRVKVLFVLLFTLGMIIILTPNLISKGVVYNNGILSIQTTNFVIVLFLIYLIFLSYAIIILIKKYLYFKNKTNNISQQFRIVSIAFVLNIAWGVGTNIILPAFGNYTFVSYGPAISLVMLTIIAYSIRKYRFLDVKYILNQSLFTIISAMFVFSVFYIVAFLIIQLFGTLFALPAYLLAGIIGILFVVSYPRVRHTLQFVIDQELLKAEYNRDEIYEAINTAVGQELDISNLQNKVLNSLIDNGITTGGYFWVFEDEERSFKESIIKKHLDTKPKLQALFNPLLDKYLTRSKQILVREEIQTLINETASDTEGILNIALEFLEATDTNILLPIFGKKKLIALIGLKRKLSESPFTLQDIDLFDSISTPISVAIERSILFEESKNFAKTLQYRVDEATAELKEAYEELQRIDAEKDDFISIAGHELRTPAAIIKMSLWMIKNYKEIKSEKALEKLENALTANERLIRLINDLLTTSRIDRSKFKLEPVKFDIVELIKNTVKDNEFLAKEKGLKLNFKDPKSSVTVEADRDKIIEVITNLISNSVKYTDRGSVNLEFSNFKSYICLCISDTGIGIKKEDQRKLFKKFSRLDHSFSTTAKIRGTGLGLYITKSILEQHKGSIKVESEGIGKGSKFIFTLPKKFIGEYGTEVEVSTPRKHMIKPQDVA